METLYILMLIGLFLYLNQQFVTIKTNLADQRDDLLQLRKQVDDAQENRLMDSPVSAAPPAMRPVMAPVSPLAVPVAPSAPLVVPDNVPADIPRNVPAEPEAVLSILPPKSPKPNLLDDSLLNPLPTSLPPVYEEAGPSWFSRFMTENPDLEKFIGENLINKIGIAILVAGIGYFVRFAIAQEWIGEIGRVMIGIVAGGGLLAVAHRMRARFAAFSSVLVAGGLSVLYFTIAIAFSDYKLFSQTAAFGIMVVITGFAIALSVAYDRQELAVMSLIGGFATPFMVSTGQGNYMVLFTYILILDVGMLVLSAAKKWALVHWVAYGFTVLLYASWLGTEVFNVPEPGVGQGNLPRPNVPVPYVGAFIFATLFYVLFAVRSLVDRLRHETRFTAPDITLFLSNTAFYYAAGMSILAYLGQPAGSWQGVFTLVLAVVNFGYAFLLNRRAATDSKLLYLLIGLVITFASLTIPVQLEGNYITMFWALEAVLLLWLGQRSGLRLVTTASVIVLGLMGVSLVMDWAALYDTASTPALPIIINKAFITSLLSLTGLGAYWWLLQKQDTPISLYVGEIAVPPYRQFVGYAALLTAYLAGLFELDYQLVRIFDHDPNRTLLLGTYHLLVAGAGLAAAGRFMTPARLWTAVSVALLVLTAYVLAVGPAAIDLLDAYYQGEIASRAAFPFHYVNLLAVGGVLLLLFRAKEMMVVNTPALGTLWPWFVVGMVVTALSIALYANAVNLHFSDDDIAQTDPQRSLIQARFDALSQQVTKVGLPILWGVCAFAFMYLGLLRRNRTYRVLSLGLFALTLAKLFVYDIRGISEGGRIAAFISLGALLLIISFMYQRIKRLLQTDPTAS